MATIFVDDLNLTAYDFYYWPTARETTFTYDDLGRVLTANYNNQRSYTYTYDAVGNRITSNENGVSSYHFHSDDNQMLTKAGRAFGYDNYGNRTDDDNKGLDYDYDDQLESVENPTTGVTTQFTYDHAGNRISKSTGSVTHHFVNDTSGELSRLLIDKNVTDNAQNYYLYGPDMISQGASAKGDRQYYISDGQGNVRYVTDSAGKNIEDYTYDPFGNEVATSPLSNFTFQEQQKDRETNLTYLRARYYDPTTGGFVTRDPVEGTLTNPQSQHGYAYAHNDPINLSDPSGEIVPALIAGGLMLWSAYDAYQGIKNCDSGQAVSGVIGLIPGVGPISRGAKIADKLGKELNVTYHAGLRMRQYGVSQGAV